MELCFFADFPFRLTVLDDEDSNNITVGSLVTVLVKLTRQTMAVSSLCILCFENVCQAFYSFLS